MALISVSNNALSDISTLPASIPTGSLTLIKSITASASANISFVHGTDGVVLDGTYLSYVFKFINIHPETNAAEFTFNFSTDAGSNYNVTKTSTYFMGIHTEADDFTVLEYRGDYDIAQGTGFQILARDIEGADADGNLGGELTLYNPSSTTFVKHFISRINNQETSGAGASEDNFIAGYGNTTSAVNAIRFQMSSGNIDDGIIKLYGVK
jgi:hypothetical protein